MNISNLNRLNLTTDVQVSTNGVRLKWAWVGNENVIRDAQNMVQKILPTLKFMYFYWSKTLYETRIQTRLYV